MDAIVIKPLDMSASDGEKQCHVTRIRGAAGTCGLAEGMVSHRATLTSGHAMATASGSHRDGKRTNSDRNSGNFSLHWYRELTDGRRVELDGRYYLSEYGSVGPIDNPTPDARQSYRKGSLESRLSGLAGSTGTMLSASTGM